MRRLGLTVWPKVMGSALAALLLAASPHLALAKGGGGGGGGAGGGAGGAGGAAGGTGGAAAGHGHGPAASTSSSATSATTGPMQKPRLALNQPTNRLSQRAQHAPRTPHRVATRRLAPGLHYATRGELARALGPLNAAHASPTALAHASPRSIVGKIALYDREMIAALSMPTNTPAEVAARDQAIAEAREQLATNTGRTLSPEVVARVDQLLHLPPVNPTLGTTAPTATITPVAVTPMPPPPAPHPEPHPVAVTAPAPPPGPEAPPAPAAPPAPPAPSAPAPAAPPAPPAPG